MQVDSLPPQVNLMMGYYEKQPTYTLESQRLNFQQLNALFEYVYQEIYHVHYVVFYVFSVSIYFDSILE